MPSSKPIVFISHIHEDAQIALCLKELLDEAFLGFFNTFVSSDGASIRAGDSWSSAIERALKETDVVLALITNQAKDRRWIYFECGGAYFAGKRVIPICCRGFPIADLSPPLSWLQAIDGSDSESAKQLIETIARAFEVHTPKCNLTNLTLYLTGSPCDGSAKTRFDTHRIGQRAFPLFLVIDKSASMSGEPIERLTESIRTLLDELLQNSPGSVAPLVSVISFGSEARELIPLSPLRADIADFTLEASGATALGSALHLLAQRLADGSQLPP